MRNKLGYLIIVSLILSSFLFSAVSSASVKGGMGTVKQYQTSSASGNNAFSLPQTLVNTTGGGTLTALKGNNISTTGGMKSQINSNVSSRINNNNLPYNRLEAGRQPYQPTNPLPTDPINPPPPRTETKPNPPYVYINWKTVDTIQIKWTDKSSVETGFRVEQQGADGNWVIVEELGPLNGFTPPQTYDYIDLAPDTEYCFRVVAYNNEYGDSEPADVSDVCAHTSSEGGCSSTKIEEVLELAHGDRSEREVQIKCDLSLESGQVVTKKLIFEGEDASGVTLNCNGATINGGLGTYNYGMDMIEVRSIEKNITNDEEELSTYERPQNITIKNCNITGSVRVWGMARNGEGDPEYDMKPVLECNSYDECYEVERKVERPGSNQFKKSSRKPGHVARARNNAPKNIVFDNVTITGVGRNPLYFRARCHEFKIDKF